MRIARRHGRPFVARGSGTGLAGGATPLDDPVVIVTTQMNRVLDVDADARVAWVEPGRAQPRPHPRGRRTSGLHYAPDPSSQQACTIGGNVATNAGGPHCLAVGRHVGPRARGRRRARRRRRSPGSAASRPTRPATTCAGCFVGSEGTMGIATRVAVRLMPDPPAVATMLCAFDSIDAAAATVTGTIAGGVLPAALEMMDARITAAVEDFVGAGYPRDAQAVLLVEVDGLDGGVAAQVDAVARDRRRPTARCSVRVAADDAERALLWKGRKSAFGAIARIAPDYYLHDAVVPRTRLVEVLRRVYEIADAHELITMNVFHAGDGNLHPLHRVRPPRARRVGARVRGGQRDPHHVHRGRRRAHRRARRRHREARPHAAAVLARRSRRAGPAARRVRSRRRREPAEGAAAREPVRRAATRARGHVDLTAGAVEALGGVGRERRRGACRSARARSGRPANPAGAGRRGPRARRHRRATSPTT